MSHETIYLSLFVQARGALRKELSRCLRPGRARRRPHGLTVNNGQGKIRGMVNISERPAEAADRAVPGHWEGDIIFGAGSSTIATLVERQQPVRDARRACPAGTAPRPSRTPSARPSPRLPGPAAPVPHLGPGQGDGRHARFSVATGVPVYFCDPHSPWQRGSNENTNGLLRQYFPRRTDFTARSRRVTSTTSPPNSTTALDKRSEWKSPCQALDEALR